MGRHGRPCEVLASELWAGWKWNGTVVLAGLLGLLSLLECVGGALEELSWPLGMELLLQLKTLEPV